MNSQLPLKLQFGQKKKYSIVELHAQIHSLGEVGKVLRHFGNERECAGGAVVWIFLHEAEE